MACVHRRKQGGGALVQPTYYIFLFIKGEGVVLQPLPSVKHFNYGLEPTQFNDQLCLCLGGFNYGLMQSMNSGVFLKNSFPFVPFIVQVIYCISRLLSFNINLEYFSFSTGYDRYIQSFSFAFLQLAFTFVCSVLNFH